MQTVEMRLRGRDMWDDVLHVAETHHVPPSEIVSRARFARVTQARHHLWLHLRESYGCTLPELGWMFGVDHTTILHGIRRAEADVERWADEERDD